MRRTVVRVEQVRRTIVAGPAVVPCASCGHDVAAVTALEASRLLQTADETLSRLVASGEVHAVDTIAGSTWICRDSLFRRSP